MNNSGRAYSRSYTVGTTAIGIADQSPNRIAIIVSSPTGGRITISPDSGVTDGLGIVIQQGDPPLKLEACVYGCFVQGRIYAIAGGAGRTVGVIEIVSG